MNANMKKNHAFEREGREWPGPRSNSLLDEWHRHEADVVGYQAPVVWDNAKGCVVTDADGFQYIDWTSGVLVTNVGHCHPRLVEAIQGAAGRLLNNYECANVERIQAAKDLVSVLPAHLDKCFFLSTGSEAIEGIIRLIKRFTGKFEVIGFHNGFHGRTVNSASVGGMASMKKGYGPTVPGIIRLPYPNPYRDPLGWCDATDGFKRYFDYAEEVLYANSCNSLGGVLVEPYQGAAGFIFPPPGWLKALESWAKAKGLVFAVDEVQAGFGRTGRFWAHEHEDLRPDLIAIGKAVGCGVAASAVAGRSEIFDCLQKGEMSSTYGGNPLASAAVSAVVGIYRDEDLVGNSVKMGERLLKGLKAIQSKHPVIGSVRGQGLVIGVELVADGESKKPAPEMVRPLIDEAARLGLLIGSVGTMGNVIRVAPPLCITPEEVNCSLEIFDHAVGNVTA